MKEFKDLEFEQNSQGGWGSHSVIGEHVLSVQCGSSPYCTPRENLDSPDKYSSFEIGIWKEDSPREWVTGKFIHTEDDEVAGWVGRDEITEVIKKLKGKQNKKDNNATINKINMEHLTKPITVFTTSVILISILAIFMAFPTQWLWNSCLVPAVDGINQIGFWQALGINFLASILFKSTNTNSKNK